MDTSTRICKKCLLREMSEADTYKTMYEYIANLNPDDKTPDQEYETRLSQCKTCDHLLSGMCRICGCYVDAEKNIRTQLKEAFLSLRLLCRNARRHNPPPLPGYSSEMVKIDPNEENRFAALRTVCFKQNPTKARSGRADSTGQTAFCWCF